MKCDVKLLSSLEKVRFEIPKDVPEHTGGSMLKMRFIPFSLLSAVRMLLQTDLLVH